MKFTFVKKGENAKFDYEVRLVEGNKIEDLEDKELLELAGFDKGSVTDILSSRRLYVSVKNFEAETLRLAMAKALAALKGHDVKTVMISADEELCEKRIAALAEGVELSSYKFDKYKSEKKEEKLEEVLVSTGGNGGEAFDRALEEGRLLADATNYVRDIVNEMPQIYTPAKMAEDAEALAKEYDSVTCEVFGKEYLKKENMNAFLAVNQSSPNEPKLIHLTYKPSGEAKGKIAYVGKGLTYDSGGLSLKTGGGMLHMKSDKGGASAALGIIKAAASIGLPFEIHSVLGCTENMIGADAYKPDDILKSREGVTIEVNNTDAEGRLVLSDCLSWTQDYVKPDYMIDMATLTGACIAGLGDYTTGVMGNNFDLQLKFKRYAEKSGELLSVLEFNDYLGKLIESDIADVRNSVPGGSGGAITAGMFLDKFVKDEYKDKWLHLDIAGPAFTTSAYGNNPVGATGAAVRSNIYFMKALAEEK